MLRHATVHAPVTKQKSFLANLILIRGFCFFLNLGQFGVPVDGYLHDVPAHQHYRVNEEQRTLEACQCKVSRIYIFFFSPNI